MADFVPRALCKCPSEPEEAFGQLVVDGLTVPVTSPITSKSSAVMGQVLNCLNLCLRDLAEADSRRGQATLLAWNVIKALQQPVQIDLPQDVFPLILPEEALFLIQAIRCDLEASGSENHTVLPQPGLAMAEKVRTAVCLLITCLNDCELFESENDRVRQLLAVRDTAHILMDYGIRLQPG